VVLELEAVRVCRILLAQDNVSPLLNLGSSTRGYRQNVQSHIDRELFAPLREAGIAVCHSDLRRGDGVDLVGDVLDPAVLAELQLRRFRCVLAANLLEHVRDRAAVADACEQIVGPGGLILATVPSSYPYHGDPIDTLYRPSPKALAAEFRRSRPIWLEEVVGQTYAQDFAQRGSSLWRELIRSSVRLALCPVRPRSCMSALHRWRWYRRPYRVSMALLEVGRG
jgi:hypothetical protein